ncbi:hypothetical protein LIER_26793 [Lithospermum erythrorhizon]|uniref:Uncharacterized protein n=1 Tax=Lithospermum erythrorhizon TaxID=34254 RepID=A0AAV3RAW4_LITER
MSPSGREGLYSGAHTSIGFQAHSIINMPYDTSAEAELLYSLIIKAKYENNRFQKPKKKPKVSTEEVDWY